MMKLSQSKIVTGCLVTALSLGAITQTVDAASFSKSIQAIYKNINVSYNGKTQSLSTAPFINQSDNSVYVPLRAFSEITGASVQWDNVLNRVVISGADTTKKDTEISNLTYENALLKQQLTVAQAELKALKEEMSSEETPDVDNSLQGVLDNITEDYGNKYKIDWEFDLVEKNSGLVLEVSYDSKYDYDLFDRLSDSSLKSFVEDILEDISDTYTSTAIEGTLIDSRYDSVKATFSYSKTGKYSFESRAAVLDDLAFDLERRFKNFQSLSFNLPIEEIVLEESDDIVVFTVLVDLFPSTSLDLRTSWAGVSSSSSDMRAVSNLMLDISEYIEEDLDMLVEGYIKDDYSGNIIANFDGRRTTLSNR